MSEYFATVNWNLESNEDFANNKYSRAHEWLFDGGTRVQASASPHIVPAPYSLAEHVDPEEAFVASLSSCHMLFFLAFAAKKKWVVNSYVDKAVGYLEKNAAGKMMMTRVILRPEASFTGPAPSREELEALHHRSHEACYIANSVLTDVQVEPA